MDLRGISPQQLAVLLGGATNLRQMRGSELAQSQNYGIDQENARLRAAEYAQRVAEAEAGQGKITYSAPYKRGGQMVRDKLIGGSVADQEILGDAKIENTPGKWFQSPDGQQIDYIATTAEPPPGWGPVADPGIAAQREATTESTQARIESQKRELKKELSGIEAALASGKDGKGNKIGAEHLEAWKDYYNSISPDFQFVKQVKKNRIFPDEITYLKVPKVPESNVADTTAPNPAAAKYTKSNPASPKSQAELDALPSGSVFLYNGKSYVKK